MELIAHRVRPAPSAGTGFLGRTFLLSTVAHVAVFGTLALTGGKGGGPLPREVTLRTAVEDGTPMEEPLPPMETSPPVEWVSPATAEILLDEFPVEPDPRFLPSAPDGPADFPLIGLPGIGDGPPVREGRRGSGEGSGTGEEAAAPVPPGAPGVRPVPAPAVVYTVARSAAGKCPAPVYPESERRRGVEGSVRLRVNVDADGGVAEVEVALSSGSGELDRAAMEAIRAWTFLPATEDGRPVPSVVLQPITFRLR